VEQNDVVTLLADWTDKNDTIKQALLELNSQSIPLLAIYPADPAREVMLLPDLLTQGKVLDALAEAGPSLAPSAVQVSAPASADEAPAAPEFGAALPVAIQR
jgi:thiol:disulfide interchange protein DsbD